MKNSHKNNNYRADHKHALGHVAVREFKYYDKGEKKNLIQEVHFVLDVILLL